MPPIKDSEGMSKFPHGKDYETEFQVHMGEDGLELIIFERTPPGSRVVEGAESLEEYQFVVEANLMGRTLPVKDRKN